VIATYGQIEPGSHLDDVVVSVAGRIQESRGAGKLQFYTVISEGNSLQYMVNAGIIDGGIETFKQVTKLVHRGDIVGVVGFIGKSKKGELSVFAKTVTLLTPCLQNIPKLVYGVKDQEIRARKRYLDLISNPGNRDTFIMRSNVFREIHNFLETYGFIEIHTPVLCSQAGGANAKPFVTHHNDLDTEMFMRIAPELNLKKMVVGGIDRVYEIGQQFRNESCDTTHNPEFMSLEFYMAYADYIDLMRIGEELLSHVCQTVRGTMVIEYLPMHKEEPITIDFTPPYRKIDMMSELERLTGVYFPEDLSTEEARKFVDKVCRDNCVECGNPRTTARMLDKLVGHYVEPQCVNPTFIMHHPLIMSPLAKNHRHNHHLTERFELFVNGMELANAFTELNDAVEQRRRFELQMEDKKNGDEEAQGIDEGFIDALEYGLPPTGGFGLGIERFVMFLTNRNSIREVLAFPAMIEKRV